MSDWKTTELFIERSEAQHSAFAVGIAIAALGNRKDGGWTYASLDRIAKLARLDRKTANQAINDLADSGELQYVPGRSRYTPSRYRVRTEVLQTGVDHFRCSLTMGDSPRVTMDETPTVTMGDSSVDHGENAYATLGETPTPPWANGPRSTKTDLLNRSIDQISDQSARERAPTDDASKDAGVDQKKPEDVGALKTALEACQRAVRRPAGEDGDSAVKLADALAKARIGGQQ
jgi:hypothetical protein